jgi:hypothetical protein
MMIKKMGMKFCFISLLVLAILGFAFKPGDIHVPGKHVSFRQPVTDSSSFTPDSLRGWGLYGSYMALRNDSVLFEVVLYQQMPQNINWRETFRIGRLSTSYAPDAVVVMNFDEPIRKWELSFHPGGDCFLRFVSGQPPSGNPVIVPLQVSYKK